MKTKIFEKNGKWFYVYVRSDSKKSVRVCRNCRTREEAEAYVEKLRFISSSPYLISNLVKNMYVPGSQHMHRLEQFGKILSDETLTMKRFYVKQIAKEFGNEEINKLKIAKVQQRLLNDTVHSASWKNMYLGTFYTIYDETIYSCPTPVPRPSFQSFIRRSKKANIFSTEELNALFIPEKWLNYDNYLFFLTTYSCGLRLGETRALRVSQILRNEKMLVINGFCKRNGERTNYNKKGSDEDTKMRIVPMPQKTFELIMEYISRKNLKQDDFIFTRNNRPIRSEYLREHFYKALAKAGIDRSNGRKLIPHSLRFTYVTRMRRNLDVESVQKIVGHTSVEMTEYYTRFGVQELIDSLQKTLPAAEKLFN